VGVLAHDDAGTGNAVVLLHAGLADRSMWREHLDHLSAAGFRAIALDLPGFGETPVTTGRQAPWEDVLETMRALDVSAAALVGNSFGAAVALRVAAVAPAAISSLVLISPPPLALEPSPQLLAAWEAEEAALERGDIDGAVDAVVEAWVMPEAPEGVRERVGAMQRRAFLAQAAARETEEAPDPLEEHPDALARLSMPALAAFGEHDMPDFAAGAREIAEHVAGAEVAMIEGAGHLAPLEAPEAFRGLLLRFL
jgi:pimeloyl-ACP methyl ester carboxylesterase